MSSTVIDMLDVGQRVQGISIKRNTLRQQTAYASLSSLPPPTYQAELN